MTTVFALIIRLLERAIPPASGAQADIDTLFDEIIAANY